MSNTNEAIADIVAEMRRGTKLPGYWRSRDLNEILQYNADRIDAAWKREMSKNASKSGADFGQLGNAAALREAVIKAITMLAVCEWPDGTNMEGVEKLRRDIDAALDVPPRNCDVGTVEEQQGRFLKFCDSHPRGNCFGCPALKMRAHCELAWAQMPYEEGSGE